jgi:hypothetical protein
MHVVTRHYRVCEQHVHVPFQQDQIYIQCQLSDHSCSNEAAISPNKLVEITNNDTGIKKTKRRV